MIETVDCEGHGVRLKENVWKADRTDNVPSMETTLQHHYKKFSCF